MSKLYEQGVNYRCKKKYYDIRKSKQHQINERSRYHVQILTHHIRSIQIIETLRAFPSRKAHFYLVKTESSNILSHSISHIPS